VNSNASTYTEVAIFRVNTEEGKCGSIITAGMSTEILEKSVKIRST
jgi:hypothetical protein